MADQALAPSVVDETYPAAVDSVATARASVSRWLTARSADTLLAGDVAIAVSEACNNVVMHGYPDGSSGSFRVLAESMNGDVRVTVSDDGCGMAPRPDSPGLGLGLPLMAALTDTLEVRPAVGDGAGTVVSMLFSTEGARSRLKSG
jgi:serine/threonine-protein kinase RsbW